MNVPGASQFQYLLLLLLVKNCYSDLTLSTNDLSIQVDHSAIIQLKFINFTARNDELNLIVQHNDIAKAIPSSVLLNTTETSLNITIKATHAGKTQIYANTTNNSTSVKEVYLRVTVYIIGWLDTFATWIGWIYFVAWSVSFYPQIYSNWRRKSVVGLNFDFLALNIYGFTMYSIFNLGLYYIPELKDEYTNRYPRGLNPVQTNDVFFAVHAVIATIVTIVQCFVCERGDQRISTTAKSFLGLFTTFVIISAILAWTSVIHWLDFIYYCSYVKLTITLIKYVPQAYMNYKRKSTVGWSIGNIFLDFTGGTLSMLQMIVNAYNYDDWVSIFGDPTKFGLGLFSVAFDIFFILQHYVFYKDSNYIIS